MGVRKNRRKGEALAVALFSTVFITILSAGASADLRVWEQGVDEESGEVSDPRSHRFLDLTAFLQPGFVIRLADEDGGRTDDSPFLQRARAGFYAQAQWWLKLRFEAEFVPTPSIQDAFVDLTPHPYVNLRAGQFQVPFLRTSLFNELDLGFLDRPLYMPARGFRSSIDALRVRDIGAMVHGRIGDTEEGAFKPVFEYQLGAFVGGGPNEPDNADNALLYAARLGLHVFGLPEGANEESDIARNTRPRLSLAGSVVSNCNGDENWNRGWNTDAEFRWMGLYVSTSFFWLKNGPAKSGQLGYGNGCGQGFNLPEGDPERPTTEPIDFISRGAHLQVQYVLPEVLFPVRNQALEVLARFDWVDPNTPFESGRAIRGPSDPEASPQYVAPGTIDDPGNAPTRYRLTFGINWFPTSDQSLRIQLNYQHNRESEDIVTGLGSTGSVRNDVLWLQITAGL